MFVTKKCSKSLSPREYFTCLYTRIKFGTRREDSNLENMMVKYCRRIENDLEMLEEKDRANRMNWFEVGGGQRKVC